MLAAEPWEKKYARRSVDKRIISKKRRITMQKYVCSVCGYIYDPVKGDPDGGIAPGVKFEDLPEGWSCPVCGAGKEYFKPE